MTIRNKILSSIIAILILIPALGININTHLCGQSEDVSKSLVIPGLLGPQECDKCHEEVVVIVKSCCSNDENRIVEKAKDKAEDKGCCKDILEYTSFNYLANSPYVLHNDFSTLAFIVNEDNSLFDIESNLHRSLDFKTRLRPYVVDIIPLLCSYLI